MLVELFIAFKASKAADSLRRIDESTEYDNGASGFDRFLAWAEKKPDRVRIEEQLHGKKMTDDGEEKILD